MTCLPLLTSKAGCVMQDSALTKQLHLAAVSLLWNSQMKAIDYLKEQTTDFTGMLTHSHHNVDEDLVIVVCERSYILMHVSRKIKNKSLHTENNLQEVLFFLEYEDLVKFGAKRQKHTTDVQ